ncbi:hypothetical protein CONPUDRAFT_73869 [Coniophora puteana RWD-64-598 SS2]|uniref:Uncharacterized protein n=1 Tax=Coniophora puteana (strain RWD-64-598) TaxID=741705 RepID=A0A5M3MNV8_CONPW|nr:uncharacterized protein CONPUDRAFT_73869 [Coniophora puteana RWD-64-598 SS2]EIW80852.1 hypothetical protein CONPUDRAFT_73869 [Coniophora puteana RWD-64-598 SS2]
MGLLRAEVDVRRPRSRRGRRSSDRGGLEGGREAVGWRGGLRRRGELGEKGEGGDGHGGGGGGAYRWWARPLPIFSLLEGGNDGDGGGRAQYQRRGGSQGREGKGGRKRGKGREKEREREGEREGKGGRKRGKGREKEREREGKGEDGREVVGGDQAFVGYSKLAHSYSLTLSPPVSHLPLSPPSLHLPLLPPPLLLVSALVAAPLSSLSSLCPSHAPSPPSPHVQAAPQAALKRQLPPPSPPQKQARNVLDVKPTSGPPSTLPLPLKTIQPCAALRVTADCTIAHLHVVYTLFSMLSPHGALFIKSTVPRAPEAKSLCIMSSYHTKATRREVTKCLTANWYCDPAEFDPRTWSPHRCPSGYWNAFDAYTLTSNNKMLITSPNTPFTPKYRNTEQELCARKDGRLGQADPFQWPTAFHPSMPWSYFENDPKLTFLWWTPTDKDITWSHPEQHTTGTLDGIGFSRLRTLLDVAEERHRQHQNIKPVVLNDMNWLKRALRHLYDILYQFRRVPGDYRSILLDVTNFQRGVMDVWAFTKWWLRIKAGFYARDSSLVEGHSAEDETSFKYNGISVDLLGTGLKDILERGTSFATSRRSLAIPPAAGPSRSKSSSKLSKSNCPAPYLCSGDKSKPNGKPNVAKEQRNKWDELVNKFWPTAFVDRTGAMCGANKSPGHVRNIAMNGGYFFPNLAMFCGVTDQW